MFWGDILTSSDTLYGIMSDNLPFISDCPIIFTTVNILTNLTKGHGWLNELGSWNT